MPFDIGKARALAHNIARKVEALNVDLQIAGEELIEVDLEIETVPSNRGPETPFKRIDVRIYGNLRTL